MILAGLSPTKYKTKLEDKKKRFSSVYAALFVFRLLRSTVVHKTRTTPSIQSERRCCYFGQLDAKHVIFPALPARYKNSRVRHQSRAFTSDKFVTLFAAEIEM